ncbi:MAG TPA: preprotein translocase subunit YajC [Croceibacterium sp.]|nr:preprotein translocase subunit YajC [Croceibacterium sp.]
MRTISLKLACALAAFALSGAAAAQDYGDDAVTGGSGDEAGPADDARARQRLEVVPYIEASQVLLRELEPGSDTVTYTSVAAGVDASVAGRNSAASVSLRYERRFSYNDDDLDGDTVSGIARAGLGLARGVTLDAGVLAARTRVEGDGSTSLGGFGGDDASTSQIYAGYAGPSVHTMAGDVEVEGHYRLGYTRVEEPDVVVLAPGATPADVFDESTTHSAYARAGVRPNAVAPVGAGVGGGWNEQNISNLDQRIRDRHVRADVTVPLDVDVAVVGGVGYEDVEISSRDALRDAAGLPVIGTDGRFVTDESAPRQIAYETSGLIWDAGVMWRPSRRTSLEAYVGRRYGTMSYHGSFAYAPDSRTALNIVVYDSVTGFGGATVDTLAGLPAQFDAFRNPITGEIGGCVATLEGNGCFAGVFGSVRSAVFRSRGAAASYSVDLGRTQVGTGFGYDRRKFVAAAGTVLAPANGVTDENVWWAAYASTRLDPRSSLTANAYANWFESGFDLASDVIGYSASLAYQRNLVHGLSGTAAVGLDGVARENLPDFMTASALLGLRYSFR